jgi:hypothetical protein
MCRHFLIVALSATSMFLTSTYAEARGGSHARSGYIKRDGTYVSPSRATNPNSTKMDNWSTKGNVNPYTGKAGTKAPY